MPQDATPHHIISHHITSQHTTQHSRAKKSSPFRRMAGRGTVQYGPPRFEMNRYDATWHCFPRPIHLISHRRSIGHCLPGPDPARLTSPHATPLHASPLHATPRPTAGRRSRAEPDPAGLNSARHCIPPTKPTPPGPPYGAPHAAARRDTVCPPSPQLVSLRHTTPRNATQPNAIRIGMTCDDLTWAMLHGTTSYTRDARKLHDLMLLLSISQLILITPREGA
jgi:hypothetical protein